MNALFRERWLAVLPATGVPNALRPWLSETASLTLRCQRHCREFRVRPLRQALARPLIDLPGGTGRCLPLREVLLECDARPVIFAHSVLSAVRAGKLGRYFAGLGSRSLGSLLFAHPGFRRGAIEYLRLSSQHPLHRRLSRHLGAQPPLWARRSWHVLGDYGVLVTEVFLQPGVLALEKPLALTR
ncbi:chorismate--pyruvate lyase family protein [Azonexus sp.]|uniref:chorismate--pyruvate lyase family protein n=1 Tax=Azonexus sp. TaxID=1872668 RepID=UPI0039E62AE3